MSTQKKWHINNNGEVRPCRARIRCDFGGESGFDNHFTNESEAIENSNRILAERFGEIAASQSKKTDVTTDEREKLIEYGIKEAGKNASTRVEVIEKGFKNNPKAYERFKDVVEIDRREPISPHTKQGIGKMLSKGINVSSSPGLRESYTSTSNLMSESSVDVLESTPGKRPTLEELMNDYGTPAFGKRR